MSKRILNILSVVALFFGAVGWHLYRIATLRPKFDKLSDTGSTVGTFFTVYLVCGMVRWSTLGGRPATDVFVGLLVDAVVLVLIFERQKRSSSLVVSMLGASAAIDLLGIALHLSGLYEADLDRDPLFVIELFLYAVCAWRFSREPESVRRARSASPAN